MSLADHEYIPHATWTHRDACDKKVDDGTGVRLCGLPRVMHQHDSVPNADLLAGGDPPLSVAVAFLRSVIKSSGALSADDERDLDAAIEKAGEAWQRAADVKLTREQMDQMEPLERALPDLPEAE